MAKKDHYAEQERKLNEMQKKRIKEANEGSRDFKTPSYELENTPEKAGKKSPTPGTDTSHPTTKQQAKKKTLKEKIDERQKTISGY